MSRFAEQKAQAGPGLAWDSALPGRLMLWVMISGQKFEQRAAGPVVVLGLTGGLLGQLEASSSKGGTGRVCGAVGRSLLREPWAQLQRGAPHVRQPENLGLSSGPTLLLA